MSKSGLDDEMGQTRDDILVELADRMEFAAERIEQLLATEEQDEMLLMRWTRTQGYLAGQFRKLMKDKDIDTIRTDIELLKEVTDVEDYK